MCLPPVAGGHALPVHLIAVCRRAQGRPAVLEQRTTILRCVWTSFFLRAFLYNLSIVGDTTADLLKRFTAEIEARQSGDIIFFAAAINDTQFVNGRPLHRPAGILKSLALLRLQSSVCAFP